MFCYVVLAHAAPDQVLALVRRIKQLSPQADVVVRHSVPGLLGDEEVEAAGGVRFESGIHVRWGGWELVDAALEALRFARTVSRAGAFVLISGQDYPIRNLSEWERQVGATHVDALIDRFPPCPTDTRYRWWMVDSPQWLPHPAARVLRYALWRLLPLYRPVLLFYRGRQNPRWNLGVRRLRPFPRPVTKGSLWMTVSRGALEDVLTAVGQEGRMRPFRRVRIPDESYLQSVLVNSGIAWLDCPTTHARFEWDDWSAATVTARELDYAAAGPAAFARKFPASDAGVIAKADALASRSAAETPPVAATPCGLRLTGADPAPGARDAMFAAVPVWSGERELSPSSL